VICERAAPNANRRDFQAHKFSDSAEHRGTVTVDWTKINTKSLVFPCFPSGLPYSEGRRQLTFPLKRVSLLWPRCCREQNPAGGRCLCTLGAGRLQCTDNKPHTTCLENSESGNKQQNEGAELASLQKSYP